MRLRTKTVKAPEESTVYSSRSRLQQRRFSSRVTSVNPSRKRQVSSAPQSRKQATLTQLDFASFSSSSKSSFVDDGIEASTEDEWPAPRSSKRRKRDPSEEGEVQSKRQNTLTQVPDFFQRAISNSNTEEESSDLETNLNNSRPPNSKSGRIRRHPPSPSPPAHDGMRNPITANASARRQRLTPASSLRREVPSSQSPAESPLSIHQGSPMKLKRSPLEEIHPNVLAQRDSESPPKRQKFHHDFIVKDSLSDESDLGGDENSDPDNNVKSNITGSCFAKPRSCGNGAGNANKPPSSPVTPISAHDATIHTSQASTLSMSPSPFKRPPLPLHARYGSASPLSNQASPNTSFSPSTSAQCSFKRPRLPPHAQARRVSNSVSPSPSPSQPSSAPQPHNQNSLPPLPTFDSQFTINVDSQLPSSAEVKPLPDLKDSCDIITASQLFPGSSQ